MSHKKRSTVLMHRPQLRLAQLVDRAGGISRDAAIAQAEHFVEELRAPSLKAIDEVIERLEKLCARKPARTPLDLAEICRGADDIITLAGMFAVPALPQIAKKLCDLACAFKSLRIDAVEPIAVHVRALRLLSPSSNKAAPEVVSAITAELNKVAEHFNVRAPEESEDWLIEYPGDVSASSVDSR